jgi:hypothetical protein
LSRSSEHERAIRLERLDDLRQLQSQTSAEDRSSRSFKIAKSNQKSLKTTDGLSGTIAALRDLELHIPKGLSEEAREGQRSLKANVLRIHQGRLVPRREASERDEV